MKNDEFLKHYVHEIIIRFFEDKNRDYLKLIRDHCNRALEELDKEDP